MKSILSTTAAQNLLAIACLKQSFSDDEIVSKIVTLKTTATDGAYAEAVRLITPTEEKK